MAKKIRVWDGTAWQDVAPSLPYDNPIPKTIFDAKGDIVTASASDTPAILTRGANGTVLVSDSSTSTGLAWQPYAAQVVAGKNKIINGDMLIWQRGTSFSGIGGYGIYSTADRFRISSIGGSSSSSRQAFTAGNAIPGYEPTYYMSVSTASSAMSYFDIGQPIEDVRTFAGQTVTFSFWAKAAANGTTILPQFIQNFGSGGSTQLATNGPSTIALTTSWVRYSATISVPSIVGKTIGANSWGSAYLAYSSGTINSVTIDTWGWQVESGSVATQFTTATGTIQGELAACQRYYYRTSSPSAFAVQATGMATSTTAGQIEITLPVTLRIPPTLFEYGSVIIADGIASSAITSLVVNSYNQSVLSLSFSGAAGLTQYRPYRLINNATVNGYISVGSEL